MEFVKDNLPGISKVMFHNIIYFGIDELYPLSAIMSQSDAEIVQHIEEARARSVQYPFAVDFPILKPEVSEVLGCSDFFTQLHIDAEGNAGGCGCSIAPNKDFGNILSEGIGVWNNLYFRGMRSMAINSSLKKHPVCRNCVRA